MGPRGRTTWIIASSKRCDIMSMATNLPPVDSPFRMLPPLHLKIFVRDLGINIVYSGDGDLAQGLFEDYILHKDEKQPPLKRGHYSRTLPQMEECIRYIDFCIAQQPGSFEQHDSLLPLTRDSSRLIYTLVKIVEDEDNRSPSEEMMQLAALGLPDAPTLRETGQQWDAPNGWAPLQWIAYKGLKNYGHDRLAKTPAYVAGICFEVIDQLHKLLVDRSSRLDSWPHAGHVATAPTARSSCGGMALRSEVGPSP